MSEIMKGKGECLCAAVKFKANTIDLKVGACHCDTCRKWGGGPYMGVDCSIDVDFENVETLSVFNSSDWAERGFCATCGTHMFYRLKESGQYIMPAGLLSVEADCDFDHQVFIDSKPDYYDFSNETKNMTGAELFAMFAPPAEE
ncbi:MAG: GFA family protein [Gammaproteobacteria bacterium]